MPRITWNLVSSDPQKDVFMQIPVSCSWGAYQRAKSKFIPKDGGIFAEAISVRKAFLVILQCLLWFTEELLSLFSSVWFLAAFVWKAALMILNTWSQQCSFLDCWLSLAHFLISSASGEKKKKERKETLWVKMSKSFLNATKLQLVFLFKKLQQYAWIGLHVPNSAALVLSGSTAKTH